MEGLGLECDKLSRKAADAMFDGLMGKLIADSKPLAGKTLVATHIDSWEVGSQNWTPAFREEFRRRRGYDPLPFLPVMTGRVVDSLEVSERFLWDLRQTISELVVENYAGRFRELAHQHGLRLSIEAYDVPCDDMTYAGQADEPMGEFWSWTFGGGVGLVHGDVFGGAHLWQADPGGGGVHGDGQGEMAGASGQDQGAGGLGVLRGDQPVRVPSLRDAAVAGCEAGDVHGAVGAALRADGDVVGAVQGLA